MVTLEEIVQKMIDAGEPEEAIAAVIQSYKPESVKPSGPVDGGPETYWSGALQGAKEGIVGGLRGFERATTPQAIGEAIKQLPGGILEQIKAAVAIGTDLPGTFSKLVEGAKNLPATAKAAMNDVMTLAATNPEGFGEAVGGLSVDTGLGLATARGIPLATRPIASKTGALMESIGTQGKWPIRMVGAHQLGSGNPLGLGVMALPEVMTAGGRKLQQFGQGGVVRLTRPETQFASDVEKSLFKSLDAVGTKTKDGLKELDKAVEAEKKSAGAIRLASGKREAAIRSVEDAADLAQMDTAAKAAAETTARTQIEAAKTGLTPGVPRITETVKAPGQSMTTTYGEASGSGLTPLEEELLKRATSVKPAGTGPRVSVTQPVAPPQRDLSALSPGQEKGIADLDALDEFHGREPGLPKGNGLGSSLNITKTESNRTPLSKFDARATEADMDSLRRLAVEHPDWSNDELIAEAMKERSGRSSGLPAHSQGRAQVHVQDYYLNKLEKAALNRDKP